MGSTVRGKDVLKHRKGIVRIKFLEKDGKPLASHKLKIEQTGHSFLFGCGAFETEQIVCPESEEKKAFYEERMKKWLELFNFGTLPFYWSRFEPEPSKPETEKLKKMALWLKERKITLKGHPLCWHTLSVPWLLNMEPEDILNAQKERIKREVTDFKGLIDMWDVINEVVIMPDFKKEDNGITRLCRQTGRIEMIREMFEQTRAYNPGAVLLLNDFNTSESYEILIEGCLKAGIKIDAIGIQSHQHQGYWGREKLERILDRFSHFGIPIHFTENTFISGHLMPPEIEDLNDYRIPEWPSTPEGEERQAENVEEFYRILFQCPYVEAVTTWAFQDHAWLKAPAGLIRTDNSEKPAYDTLKRLIKSEWLTKEECITDENGYVEFTGFLGEYQAVSEGNVYRFKIKKESDIMLCGPEL